MDDTNTKKISDDTAATEVTQASTEENPFGALKQFDVEPKEGTSDESLESSEKKTESVAGETVIEDKEEKVESENIEKFAEADEKADKKTEAVNADESTPAETEEVKEELSTPPTQAEGLDSSDSSDQKPEPPSNPKARWYVVHTFAGHENKVATALKQRIEAERLENLIYDILVPTQDKIEIRGGKKETVKEKIFPGYILIKMELSDLSWLAVRTTQGVTSFIGAGNKPTPISEAEVATIVKFTTQGASPTFKDVFMVDDTVKIIDGPFAEFIGKVDSVDKEKGRVRVLVSIFGRETPVELDFLQVQKL